MEILLFFNSSTTTRKNLEVENSSSSYTSDIQYKSAQWLLINANRGADLLN